MKISVLCISFFMLLCGGITTLFAEDLSGPAIFGFRLGMTIEQINEVASTHGYTVKKSLTYSKEFPRYDIEEQGKDIATLVFKYNGKRVSEMILRSSSFNSTRVDENFILKFLQHYKIPVDRNLVKETRDDLIIPVPDNGYEILFHHTNLGGYVKISATSKTSDLDFR